MRRSVQAVRRQHGSGLAPGHSDVKWEGEGVGGDDGRDVFLLLVDDADNEGQQLFHARLQFRVALPPDCT